MQNVHVVLIGDECGISQRSVEVDQEKFGMWLPAGVVIGIHVP